MNNSLYQSVMQVDADKNAYDFACSQINANQKYPEINFFGITYSFSDIQKLTLKTVHALAAAGLKKGDNVIISIISTPEAVALLYACCYIGCVPVLVDVRASFSEMSNLIEKTDAKMLFLSDYRSRGAKLLRENHKACKIVIVSVVEINSFLRRTRNLSLFMSGEGMLCISGKDNIISWKQFIAAAGDPEKTEAEIEAMEDGSGKVIFASSGTTGEPKYVVLDNRKLNLSAVQHCFMKTEFEKIESVLSIMPVFTCFGFIMGLQFPMIIGRKIFLVPEHRIKRIPYWVKRLRPSAIAATPGHFKEMLTSKYLKNTEVSFIKYLLCGGDFFDVKDIERVNNFLAAGGSEAKIINGYGMTEVASGAVQLDLQNYHPDSIGSCLPLVSIKVVKEGTQTEVEDGQEGEVCLYTPCQTEGYYKNPEATEKLLKKHADGREWIHTGDVGYIGENGCLYLKGRIKRMVVTQSGTKIFLNQLEEVINRIEGVQKSAAVMIQSPDDGYSKYLFLYVVLKEHGIVSRSRVMKKIKQLCYSELPQYLVPDYIRLCKKLEQTPSGKISYTILEKKSEEQLKHRLVKRYYTLR